MTRKKFTSKFKTKVALEAIKERESLSVLAQKYELLPQQISNWKRELLNGADSIFEGKSKSKKTEAQEKEDDSNLMFRCKNAKLKRALDFSM